MRQMFVAGNWKMNGRQASIKTLMTGLNDQSKRLNNVKIAVCPPSIYISFVKSCLSAPNIFLGGQDAADESQDGAFTGEISVEMLKDLDCQYIILGHSERRALYGESDQVVARKVEVAIKNGLTAILCVGETLEQREAGQVEVVIERQLNAVINQVGIKSFSNIVLAYEPVWAIGTGKTATAKQAQQVHAFIRALVAKKDSRIAEKLIIQYGGSVKPSNAKELFQQVDIDGGLIGGASLNAHDFIAICEAAGA